MLGGVRGPSRTSLLILTLAALLGVSVVASASLITYYGTPGGSSPGLLLVAAGPMSIFAVLLVVVALSRPEGVEEVFLVHDSGLLLVHFSKTVRPEKDRDIVVGMLTAVQGFIRDAFAKGSPSDLRMLDFGDRRILIFKGSHSYLALVVRGRVPLGLTGRMRRTLVHLEQRYQAAIERWNGSVDSLAGADDLLLAGRLGDEMRQLAAQVPHQAREELRVTQLVLGEALADEVVVVLGRHEALDVLAGERVDGEHRGIEDAEGIAHRGEAQVAREGRQRGRCRGRV